MAVQKNNQEDQKPERLNLSGVLFRSVESAVVVADAKGTITGFNQTAERITEAVAKGVVAKPIAVLPAPLRQIIEETLSSGKPVLDRSVELFPTREDKGLIHANTSLCLDSSGRIAAVVAVFHDLGAARKLELRTRRLERLASIGTLSAGVAHEIKNALVAVKSFAGLLSERNAEPEMTGLIGREVNRIDALVSQLLKFAGPAKPVFSRVGVHELIENSLRLVQHQIKTRKIQLVRALEAGTDTVRGDGKQLEQAFINLLLNAIEAMEETGTLTIATEIVIATEHVSRFEQGKKNRQIQISIKDTGAGVPAELLPQLFVPFVTTKPEGTGLGLAITSRIVHEHRGRIKVESEVNRGTTFQITLPLSREA